MRKNVISNFDLIASIAQQELKDLAVIDGGSQEDGDTNFYRLKKHAKTLRREERGDINNQLDAPGGVQSRYVFGTHLKKD